MQCCVDEVCQLVVVSGEKWQSAMVDSDTAVSLIATLSEDPASWSELLAYWPRYRTPVVLQDLNELRFTSESTDQQSRRLEPVLADDGWLFIDFDEKRIATSPSLSFSGRDHVFDLFSDRSPEKRWPLSIHLPPWWELLDATRPQAITQARSRPLVIPKTDREFLYGKPMIEYFASRILVDGSEKLRDVLARKDMRRLHGLTVDIHRQWLMTPREDLRGLMPRHLLHGAHDWISRIVEGQALRAQEGCPLIAAPTHVQGFETAAMGTEEVVIYFDLCRHLIACGWEWLIGRFDQRVKTTAELSEPEQKSIDGLIDCLVKAKAEFLSSSYEGGSTPNFIIQCSRRRVPRSPNIVIEGLDEQEVSQHMTDCDCPICLMMEDGRLGPTFTALDGYHLELDEEFAFSLFETHQQWQEESLFLGVESNEIDDEEKMDEDEQDEEELDEHELDEHELDKKDSPVNRDEFASAWDGIRSTEPFPGDPAGHIKLAFMLAEIVAHLQTRKVEPPVLQRLNGAFKQYRQAEHGSSKAAKLKLIEQLELIAVRFPQLVPRIADFQSQLDLPVQRA
jgi:hypothetical protein